MDPPNDSELRAVRDRVDNLLEHLIWLLDARDLPFMPAPYPDDPTGLPPFFPDGECAYTTYVRSCNDPCHEYEVKLRHFDPEKDDQFLTWELLIRRRGTNDRFQLGCLSIDQGLYFNQEPATFTGSFVLNELKTSMGLGTPITIVPT